MNTNVTLDKSKFHEFNYKAAFFCAICFMFFICCMGHLELLTGGGFRGIRASVFVEGFGVHRKERFTNLLEKDTGYDQAHQHFHFNHPFLLLLLQGI